MSTLFQERPPAKSAPRWEAAPVHLVFPRWLSVLLAIAIVVPWLVIAGLFASRIMAFGNAKSPGNENASPADAAAQSRVSSASLQAAVQSPLTDHADATHAQASSGSQVLSSAQVSSVSVGANEPLISHWTPGKTGPWGQIETKQFEFDVPDEYVFVPPSDQPPVRWSFPGYTKEKVLATLREAGVPESEVSKLEQSAKWTSDDGVASVEPGDPLILSLAPEVRSKLYAILVVFPQNARQVDPIWFRPDQVDLRLEGTGLAAESIALLKRLLYAQGKDLLLFADFDTAVRSLPNDDERKRFMKAVSRKQAVMAHVRLDPEADVEKIAQYWGIGGRRKDLLPFLSALRRVEKGCNINVIYLLPNFARDHIYRHPFNSIDDKSVKQDCFWSAFNFFNDVPDNRFNDMEYIRDVLTRDYYQVQEPSQLGDVILVPAENKSVIHAAAYVADDLVFTKNGEDFRQPWMLMHMADMIDTYTVKYPNSGKLKPEFFRKKSL